MGYIILPFLWGRSITIKRTIEELLHWFRGKIHLRTGSGRGTAKECLTCPFSNIQHKVLLKWRFKVFAPFCLRDPSEDFFFLTLSLSEADSCPCLMKSLSCQGWPTEPESKVYFVLLGFSKSIAIILLFLPFSNMNAIILWLLLHKLSSLISIFQSVFGI